MIKAYDSRGCVYVSWRTWIGVAVPFSSASPRQAAHRLHRAPIFISGYIHYRRPMLLWNPLPSDFLNTNLPSATLASVGAPLRPASILAEYLLRFLAKFPVTGLGRYRHTVSRLPSVFEVVGRRCNRRGSWKPSGNLPRWKTSAMRCLSDRRKLRPHLLHPVSGVNYSF